MAGGYQVGIASETKAFKQGIEAGIIDPLEDAQKELLELGRNRGPEQLERSLKDAEDASEDLADETKRTARAIEQEYRDAYRKVKTDSDDAFDKASEGAEEFKDEAKQSIKETAASFSDVTDAVDLVQEVAANAFSGFGPAGVAAGAAAAIGIGAAVSGFEQVSEAEQESRERAADWAQAYVDAGGRVLSAATTAGLALDIVTDGEKFKTAQANAEAWGVDVSVAIAAMAGETWALSAANRSLSEQEKAAAAEAVKLSDGGEALADMLVGQTAQVNAGRTALEQLTGEMEAGSERADAYSRYLAALAENTAGATWKVDEFGDSVATLPDGTVIYIDAETKQATTDVDKIEKRVYGIRDKTVNVDVRGNVSAAEAQIRGGLWNRWNGKELRLQGRVVTPMGGDV